MMHRRGTRGLVLAVLSIVIGIAALGVPAPSLIEAKPIKAVSSISNRVAVDTKNCEGDGGEIDVAYSYENDTLVGATTTCNGGYFDGVICVHDQTTIECYKRPSLTQTPEPFSPSMPESADPGQNPQTRSTVLEENTAPSGGAAEDPTRGEEVTSNSRATTDEVVLACESLGGVATVDTHSGVGYTNVHCRGGVLDGSTCIVGHYDTYCTFFRVATDVTFTDGTTPDSLIDAVENVNGGGRIVVMSQSGDPVNSALTQAEMCGVLGGEGYTEHDFREDGSVSVSQATCKGGLLDGMICINNLELTNCQILASTMLDDPLQMDPTAGNEMPANSAPAAPSPTAMPTQVVDTTGNPTPTIEPTMMPTVMPTTEPTMAPTEPVDPPTFPTPPTDDVVAPPGEAEDPVVEPTPTVVVLT